MQGFVDHRVIKKLLFVAILLFGDVQKIFAQADEKGRSSIQGSPRVIHYTRKDFNSDPQIWTMCQDKEGILYFGSNSGTLIYDGERWQNVKLPNNSSVRSLATSKEGKVYAGGFNEFGVIKRDNYGNYFYESMVNLLRPEDRNIENIWAIHEVKGHIVFRSYRLLISIINNKAVTSPATGNFDYSTVLNDKLFVRDGGEIKSVDMESLEMTFLFGPDDLNHEHFLALLPGYHDQNLLAITRQGAFFELDSNNRKAHLLQRILEVNSNNRITCAIKSSSGNYYLGTLTTKVISLNSVGENASASEIFDELQDNTVLNLFESNEGNIWALLNNGIDCIDVSSPVTRLFDDASILDVLISQNLMYLATNQGVLVAQFNEEHTRIYKKDFKNVSGLEGQAWSLQKFEDQVLCGHDNGVVVFSKNGYTIVTGARGVWKTIAIQGKPGYFLVCTYDGLFLMKNTLGKGFEIMHKLEGFNESSRDILPGGEPGVFWVCHGYKGVFRIKVDSEFKRVVGLEHFKDKNGLPSPFNINVFNWNNQIVFSTNNGIYTYDASKNKFERHAFFAKLFGTESNIRQLLEFGDKTWFVDDDEAGYFITKETDPKPVKGLFLQLKGTFNQSMECIEPVNTSNVLMGTREGLYSFDLAYNSSGEEAPTVISGVSFTDGTREYQQSLLNSEHSIQQLPHNTISVRFNFSVPGFDDKTNIQYRYKVDGIHSAWSDWQESSYKEYTLLRPGNYVFRVQARSLLGEKANEASYYFQVIPVWYKTTLAYVMYILITLVLIAILVNLIQRRIDFVRKKTIAEEEKKRKVLQLEIERIKLEQEKEEIVKDKELLEEDVIFKSKELANYTMLLVKKRELLGEMSEELKTLKEIVRNDQARHGLRELLRKININLQSEEHLKVFEANFERVHHEFFAQLRSNFPDLTQKELQLCAFVKMNLTNKEIASILNISVRGIETARYRLRKRLCIDPAEDMADFLDKLYQSNEKFPESND